MRSLIGKNINRETEQAILDIICSFHTHASPFSYTSINIFVRKTRELGRVYTHTGTIHNGKKKFRQRKYYSEWDWVVEDGLQKQNIIQLLLRARSQAMNYRINLKIQDHIMDIVYSNRVLKF